MPARDDVKLYQYHTMVVDRAGQMIDSSSTSVVPIQAHECIGRESERMTPLLPPYERAESSHRELKSDLNL